MIDANEGQIKQTETWKRGLFKDYLYNMSINWPNSIINIKKEDYFNLVDSDISKIQVVEYHPQNNCLIVDLNKEKAFKGFKLATSAAGNAITLCDVDFHKSISGKYQPRLIFRRTDKDLKDKKVGNGINQRISFHQSTEGYNEFWKMVGFLKGFKDLVDTGNFDDEYRMLKQEDVIGYLDDNIPKIEEMVNELGFSTANALQYVSTVKILKSNKDKIQEFVDNNSSEKDVQNWIDEDGNKHRRDRCMIFGLEFIDHKREGGVNGNRYDIFTKVGFNTEERVLIELKSPSDDLFEERASDTTNGKKIDYSLSRSLSRAIPQILEYRKDIEEKRAGDSELQKVGENAQITISKCIIVIGSTKSDTRWKKNLLELRRSFSASLEIWTYTDLIEKLNCTIKNLSERNK